jgi:hypothetical protein
MPLIESAVTVVFFIMKLLPFNSIWSVLLIAEGGESLI